MDNNSQSLQQMNAQEWSPEPFAARKSQNIGHADFLKAGVLHAVLGAVGGGFVGYVVAKTLRLSNSAASLVKTAGVIIGTFSTSFRLWRKQENAALNVHETLQQYKQFDDITPRNEYLAEDNAILHRIVAHQREQLQAPTTHIQAKSSEHAMMLAEHAQSHAIH